MKILAPSLTESILASARDRAHRCACFGVDDRPVRIRTRNHKKRHSVNRERSYADRRKAAKHAASQQAYVIWRRAYSDIVRRYFAGELPDLSALANIPFPA